MQFASALLLTCSCGSLLRCLHGSFQLISRLRLWLPIVVTSSAAATLEILDYFKSCNSLIWWHRKTTCISECSVHYGPHGQQYIQVVFLCHHIYRSYKRLNWSSISIVTAIGPVLLVYPVFRAFNAKDVIWLKSYRSCHFRVT